MSETENNGTETGRESRDRLERLVSERTAELLRINEALEAEIRQRRQIEAELRENVERFRAVTEHSADLTLMSDEERTLTYAAPSVRQYGYEPEELIGLKADRLVHEDDLALVVAAHEAAMAAPGVMQPVSDFRGIQRDGRVVEFRGKISYLGDVPGVEGFIFNGIDVTETNELAARLRHAEKMDAIGQLAGGVAHDFNNQLAGILGNAELLLHRLQDDGLKQFAESIVNAALRSSDLTRQLLAFARKGQMRKLAIDVHATVDEVISLLQRSLDKKIQIKCDLRAERPVIRGDTTQVQNALLNLALNARDAMPEGGTLRFFSGRVELTEEMRTDGLSQGELIFDVVSGSYIAIGVEDTGVGMDAQTVERIFEPFFTTKEPGKGTGMGLAGVYGIVKHHGGSIRVKSQLDKGTKLELLFPVDPRVDRVEQELSPVVVESPSLNLLVVDDEPVVLEVIGAMLEQLGHRATLCSCCEEAEARLGEAKGEFDLVILDMVMPGKDGRETYRALKDIDGSIEVMLASGYSLDSDARELIELGVRGVIQKPFSLNQLSNILSDHARK